MSKSFQTHESLAEAVKAGPLAFVNVPEEIYRPFDAVNHSSLRYMKESPAKYRWEIDHPRGPSAAMALGTAIHCALLEPDKFDDIYAIQPKMDGRTKEGKAAKAEWAEKNGKKIAITDDDMDTVHRVVTRAQDNDFWKQFFVPGIKESSCFAKDPETGLLLKGRIDNVLEDRRVLVDLKTTDCALRHVFNKDITDYGYLTQAAFYCDLVEAASGWKPEAFVIVAIEKSRDCDMVAFYFEREVLDVGRKIYRKWLTRLNDCLKSNQWPGYDLEFVRYQPPEWLVRDAVGDVF